MTRALVTGATGFIGAHVVRALLEEGVEVRALVRAGSDDRNLRGLKIERVEGDLREAESPARAVAGVDVVFHVGSHYELTQRERARIFAVNVEGTRQLMKAALRAGVTRVVHTSSVAAVGHARRDGRPADEGDWADPRHFAGPYEASKYHSEKLVHALVQREGLPAVVVNPTAPIGALDRRPTPTGRMIIEAAGGRMPAYLKGTGLNIVPVGDVARGMVRAWQRGRVGERYILGHGEGNLTLYEVLARAAAAGGQPPPRRAIPWWVAMAYAQIDENVVSRVAGRAPRAPIAGVRLARHRMWYTVEKAVRELGMPQSPLEAAFAEAVAYFQHEGMLR